MKHIGMLLGFLALSAFFLPALTAQDDKKKANKPGPGDSLDKKKEPAPKKEKLVYGQKFVTKIISIKPESIREFTIDTKVIDPERLYNFNVWKAQQLQSLAQQQVTIAQQTTLQGRLQQMQSYQRSLFNYQVNLPKQQATIYKSKPVEVRGTENAKVRSMSPPVEFDDKGFVKKYTKKQLLALRDKTGLPGYPVDFDSLKPNQIIEIYMVKQAAPARKGKKKGPDDIDAPMATMPEYVMIVILGEGKQ